AICESRASQFLLLLRLVIFAGARLSHTVFFCNDTPPTDIYTLSLHDALPISHLQLDVPGRPVITRRSPELPALHEPLAVEIRERSEEHTSELQSRSDLVCRLLLEKKKTSASRPP